MTELSFKNTFGESNCLFQVTNLLRTQRKLFCLTSTANYIELVARNFDASKILFYGIVDKLDFEMFFFLKISLSFLVDLSLRQPYPILGF